MLAETPFYFYVGVNQYLVTKLFMNIKEGFALIYHLCLHNKDIFADDFLHKSEMCCFNILQLFYNEARGSILLNWPEQNFDLDKGPQLFGR